MSNNSTLIMEFIVTCITMSLTPIARHKLIDIDD